MQIRRPPAAPTAENRGEWAAVLHRHACCVS